MIGAKYIYIPGFRGMAKINPALRRNEVQAGHSGYVGYKNFFRDTLIKDGKALALWYQSDFDDKGNPIANPLVTEFPAFHDVYKEVHGKMPSGPKWAAYRWFRVNVAPMTLAIFSAKGTPKEAVAALRKGYYATATDAEYVKSQKQLTQINVNFLKLDAGLKVLKTYRNVTPEVKAVFAEMVNKGGATKRRRSKGKKK
jgi:hypothetical protein